MNVRNVFALSLLSLQIILSTLLISHENTLAFRDLISIEDITKDEIEHILDVAQYMESNPQPNLLQGFILATCFFEPSTRTRLSFESAMHRLGGNVIGFSDSSTTSTKKGETLADMMQGISSFADIIVIRHPQVGSAQQTADVADVPVINGGDGFNQHPSQTLVDLFTIRKSQGKIDDLHIAIAGDLKYGRTVHSLCLALSHYNVHLYFISPPSLVLPDHLCEELHKKGIPFSFHETIEETIPNVDILYMTRIQKERFPEGDAGKEFENNCLLKLSHLIAAKDNLRILHPLPRMEEIETSIDATPHAYYFQQMANGVPVRMALLSLLLDRGNFSKE
jgi:aspartate carbamoyltransferase catalytic subunit